jgi:SAM-dependent methyltransferase
MRQDLTNHPAYSNPDIVRQFTQWHISQGHTIFQLFQCGANEIEHSKSLLKLIDLPLNASVVSLGSGVGGMEHYWKQYRPDLKITLVNISQVQLDLTICDGEKICADAETYQSLEKVDAVIIAYTLGHVDVEITLKNALSQLKVGGVIVVFDIFNCTAGLCKTLGYDAPTVEEIESFCTSNSVDVIHRRRLFSLGEYAAKSLPWVAEQAFPALFIIRKI